MRANCVLTGDSFEISEAEVDYCRRFSLPLPVLSPRERLRELAVWRNRVHLFKSTCAITNKQILSMVPPEVGFSVCDISVWNSDDWDPLEFGRDYDFSRPFFDQWIELARSVPMPNLQVVTSSMENSDYTNGITGAKNCYLLFGAIDNEDCLYSVALNRCRSTVDSIHCNDCELCYDCLDVHGSYQLRFSEHCTGCSNSYFLSQCVSCKNCFGCVNLAQAEYCFFNQQLSKADYENRIKELNLSSAVQLEEQQQQFTTFKQGFPVKSYFGSRNEGSRGNFLNSTKNCCDSFFVTESEDLYHCLRLYNAKQSFFQLGYGIGTELIYNCSTIGGNSYNLHFCDSCWSGCRDLEYCCYCSEGVANCFGSIGLKRKSYCVLNKQYSKEDYEALVLKIREHMLSTGEYGRYFPPRLSPYSYNCSEVMDYFPLDRPGAEALGYRWRNDDLQSEADVVVVPDTASELGEDACSKAYRCSLTGKPYRLIKQEVDFYRTNDIPPPKIAPLERIKRRLSFYNIPEITKAPCAKCRAIVDQIVPHLERGNVLCESCFIQETRG